MTEQGRLAQVEALKAQGWTEDWETARFEQWEIDGDSVGSPTYLRAPDGRIYECSGGVERLVAGDYQFRHGRRRYVAGKMVEGA